MTGEGWSRAPAIVCCFSAKNYGTLTEVNSLASTIVHMVDMLTQRFNAKVFVCDIRPRYQSSDSRVRHRAWESDQ